jgi:hypothetical protein
MFNNSHFKLKTVQFKFNYFNCNYEKISFLLKFVYVI